MNQIRVYNSGSINGEHRLKGHGIRDLRVLPDRKRVDFIANQMDLVSLTEFHESDKDLSGVAATLEIVRSVIERLSWTIIHLMGCAASKETEPSWECHPSVLGLEPPRTSLSHLC